MKTRLVIALCALVAAVVFVSIAATTPLMGTLASVNGSTNTTSVAGTFTAPRGSWIIQHGPLSSTNALTLNAQWSVDNTNFITVATWNPSTTNSATEFFNPVSGTITNYVRANIVTTNAVNVLTILQN